MERRSSTWLALVAAGLALAWWTLPAGAEDKPDPTGSWQWKISTPDGQEIELKGEFKLDGDKLTGTVSRGDSKTKIDKGKFKDGEISFEYTRDVGGQTIKPKYKGKLKGDTIKGKIEIEIMGENRSFDWEAKRVKK